MLGRLETGDLSELFRAELDGQQVAESTLTWHAPEAAQPTPTVSEVQVRRVRAVQTPLLPPSEPAQIARPTQVDQPVHPEAAPADCYQSPNVKNVASLVVSGAPPGATMEDGVRLCAASVTRVPVAPGIRSVRVTHPTTGQLFEVVNRFEAGKTTRLTAVFR